MVASRQYPIAPNLILANPPYVRHHHLQRNDKERLQSLAYQMAGVRVNGLAGLYVYFLLLATAWMGRGRLRRLEQLNEYAEAVLLDLRWLRHYGFPPLDVPTTYGGLSR